jgi:chromosome segregation ATPase
MPKRSPRHNSYFLPLSLFCILQGVAYCTRHHARDQDSATKSLAALKSKLEKERAAQEKDQVEVNTLARAVGELKKSADGLAATIPFLEEKVRHLDNKVLDGLIEIHAKELSLERTINTNEDYKSHNSRLTKKLESKFPISFATWVLCF